ncbi:RidA family protein [Romeria aff. gracilis LEGE 07310]|uniref:RidA family protein n=1 Tax=Vasconcelosia minhoensis LEGE 07310 TaxID=915328 RepID=A0A8J7DMT3_9CYAN|nr:RidA family protein [Romeria gracilis]MBE9077270.1 RidA family protein [Romeria aff. gracilis LEGE 07310]
MNWKRILLSLLVAFGIVISLAQVSAAQDITRYPIPNSDFPIARAVELPADATLVYVSGQVPSVIDETADPSSVEAFGDTESQTVSVLEKIEATLDDLDLSMSDVVKMQVFLVGDPTNDGMMDFSGFMDGYTQFFGTEEQPNLPARSAMQVAGLVNPGWLVEIEVVAVRPS